MTKKADLDQLQEAVKRQPGSRTFAILAQRYLEEGALDEALRICRAGFEANRAFEDGAVTYLRVLRQAGDVETASDVFRQALAKHPGSAKLRVGWASVLLDSRRTAEARRLAREAIELDPRDEDAQRLLAALGETPASFRAPSSEERRALVRPWVRPVGQRKSATSLFDLTTPPPTLAPNAGDQHAFDATPAPINPIGRARPPTPMISTLGDPGEREAATGATSLPGDSPGHLTATGVEDDPTVPGPETFPGDAPSLPGETLPGAAEVTLPDDLPAFGVSRFAQQQQETGERDLFPFVGDLEHGTEMQTSPAPVSEPLRKERRPPLPQSEPSVSALLELSKRRASPRRWLWVSGAILLAGVTAAVTAHFVRQHRERKLHQQVAAIVEDTRPDSKSRYVDAAAKLDDLARRHGPRPRIDAARALIAAHLWARFGHGQRAAVERLAGSAPVFEVPLARAMLDPATVAAEPAGVDGSWHGRLVRVLIAVAHAQRQSIDEAARAELAQPDPAPAVLVATARFFRLCGERERAAELLDRARAASPAHAGAQIERALLEAWTQPPRPDVLGQLARAARGVPRHEANVNLLIAHAARAAGKHDQAVAVATEASSLDPSNAEAPWLAAVWQLAPGGDASRALAAMARQRPPCTPEARLWEAHALLLLGRPHEAWAVLGKGPPSPATGEVTGWHAELLVRCAQQLDNARHLQQHCRDADRSGPRKRVACATALLARSAIDEATPLLRTLDQGTAPRLLLAGLQALARGDAQGSLERLERARQTIETSATSVGRTAPFPSPTAPLFAMAEAYSHLNKLDQAVKILRQALALDAHSVIARLHLAISLVAVGHDTEARTLLEDLLESKPTGPWVLSAAGEALINLGHVDKAQALLRQAADRSADSTALDLLAGRVAMAEDRANEARAHFRKVLSKDPQHAEAMVALGQIDIGQNKSRRAQHYFTQALKVRPHDPKLLLLVAEAYARVKRYRDALKLGTRAIQHFVQSKQPGRATEAMITLGRAFVAGDRWARGRAEELLFEACKSKDAPAIAFLELGRLHRENRESSRAIWCFRQAIQRDAKLAVAHRDLGLLLRSKPRWRGQARRSLREYLRLSPTAPDAGRIRALLKRR